MKHKYLLFVLLFILCIFVSNNTIIAENNFNPKLSNLPAISANPDCRTASAPLDSTTITKKKFKKLFYQGTDLFFENHFELALPYFLELLKFDPDNSHINFYVGACYMNLPEAKTTALPFLQKAVRNTTIYYEYDALSPSAPVFAYFYLATVYRNNYKIGDAINNNKIFKAFVPQENEELTSEVDREIKSLEGGNVYVENPEYSKFFNKIFVERIEYDVFIRNPEQDINWWVNNLEGIKRELLVNTMINIAYSGNVNVYDENLNSLTNEQVKSIGNEPQLLKIRTPNPPYNDTIILIENQLNRQLITKIRFLEEWYFDDQTLQIGKKVVGVTPLIEEYFEDNTLKGYKPLFTLFFDEKYPALLLQDRKGNETNQPSENDTLSANNLNDTTKTIDLTIGTEYSTVVKALNILTDRIRYDVPIKNMKSNERYWVENIEYSKRESFLTQVFDMVSNGLIQAYDIFDDSLSIRKVRDIVKLKSDTVLAKTPYPPYRDTLIISVSNNFDYTKVGRFRFLEEWYLNEKTGLLAKKVVGFPPLTEIFDDQKTLKGYASLFWIYFDPKYPMKVSQRIINFRQE